MINLKKENFIAKGRVQECYAHPFDKNFCIKIFNPKRHLEKKKKILNEELNYFKKISIKKIKSQDYLFFSKYYNTIETNLGKGYLYDLIRDETTNQVSKTLSYYILAENSKISDATLKKAFNRFIRMMIKYKVIANDLSSDNICCKILKNQTIEMVIIDGLGHKDSIPLVDWFSFFARKKIERRLVRHQLDNFNKLRQHLIDNIGKE